jgi:NADPH2:quinone reductase
MRASVITAPGELDVIELKDVPKPTVNPEEVRVAVKASAVNHTDVWIRRGVEGEPPIITGIDVAGIVDSVGEEVSSPAVGDRVVLYWNTTYCGQCEFCQRGEITMCLEYGGLGVHVDGGHAEYVTVPATHAIPLPVHISFEEAAALPSNFGTAWRALFSRGGVSVGDDVAVLGSSGGVGHAAVQLAHLAGASVYAITSSHQHAEHLAELGATAVFSYDDPSFADVIRDRTAQRGVDVVIDSVGGELYEPAIKSLVRGGRFVPFGATTGGADAALRPNIFWEQLRVIGTTGCTLFECRRLLDEFFGGSITPMIGDIISLEEIPDAHERLENGDVFGKIVVDVDA